MFERYTEKALQAVFFSRFQAAIDNSEEIGIRHLLAGMLLADPATIGPLIGQANVAEFASAHSPDSARLLTFSTNDPSDAATTGPSRDSLNLSRDMPLGTDCKQVFERAATETDTPTRGINTAHLLLGILLENGAIAQRLTSRGAKIDSVRQAISAIGGSSSSST
jgi:ATP-dependent Clp protease ATP-binding subunit ClpA